MEAAGDGAGVGRQSGLRRALSRRNSLLRGLRACLRHGSGGLGHGGISAAPLERRETRREQHGRSWSARRSSGQTWASMSATACTCPPRALGGIGSPISARSGLTKWPACAGSSRAANRPPSRTPIESPGFWPSPLPTDQSLPLAATFTGRGGRFSRCTPVRTAPPATDGAVGGSDGDDHSKLREERARCPFMPVSIFASANPTFYAE